MKNVFRLLVIAALATVFALPAFAQTTQPSPTTAPSAQDEQAKADLYAQFLKLKSGSAADQKQAYDIGKQYLSKYGSPTEESDKKIVAYIQNWVNKYEAATRDYELNTSIDKKDYAKAFDIGRTWLNQEPDNLDVMLRLARAGYANVATKDAPNVKSLNPDTIRVTRHAIELIESGKAPAKWEPFASRDEALGFLYYTLGFVSQETSPADSAAAFVKVAQSNSKLKSDPSTFTNLANVYETNELKRLVDEYNVAFPAGKEITDDQKPKYQQMLDQIGKVQDRIIDAYARAAALMGNDAKYATAKKAVMTKLTLYYKQRHNDSDAGLQELVANVLSKPLMLPGQEPAPTPAPSSTSGTDGNTPKPSGTPAQPATGTGTKPAATPGSKPATPPQKPPVTRATPAPKGRAARTTSGR